MDKYLSAEMYGRGSSLLLTRWVLLVNVVSLS